MAPQQRAQLPSPPAAFTARKYKILQQLSAPDAEYTDASPKGSVDVGIRELIGELNALDGFVTTSSCAGRVSVFLEGKRKESSSAQEDGDAKTALTEGEDTPNALATIAGPGGKGGGGTWLYVSHDPVPGPHDEDDRLLSLLGLVDEAERGKAGAGEAGSTQSGRRRRRLIHFKFEPMILHVLTASSSHAQLLLKCALAAGFRESGALNLLPNAPSTDDQQPSVTPIVGVRTMGLGLESLVGYRFVENAARIARFRAALQDAAAGPPARLGEGGAEWEDAAVRRERKRAEGLRRKEEKMLAAREKETQQGSESLVEENVVDLPEYQLHGL
uniref:tRNA(Phe) 7-[(3-amino-3-carboxypropyl)-4-demethylwyosine(37)-N(4)]-methyltransferase n=1 Tax=Colletotrichum fructicola (strain Nara gc5) TaxID=1213859 RepID=L2FXZ7_COLFN